ncbi:MAG: hypothetical protein V1676_02530 [Candidatus Diapherotrites archaeon]
MNLIELCCYRLAERGIISEEAARILVTLHRRGPLNGVELAEWSGVGIEEVALETDKLAGKNAITFKNKKYAAQDIGGCLNSLINGTTQESAEMPHMSRVAQIFSGAAAEKFG